MSKSEPTPRGAQNARIFVIDDDPDIRIALTTLLAEEGYEVEAFADGQAALGVLSRRRADLVILDLRMPGMNGWEFRAAQRGDARVADIPVLAMSADLSPQARTIHADAFLQKPFDMNHLLNVVERLLRERAHKVLTARLAEAERLAALGRLAAGVGHEINNPLTFVLANLRLLAELLDELEGSTLAKGAEIASAKSMVSESIDGAERIARIVEGLQTLSRQRQGRKTVVEITQILDRALALCEHHTRPRARVVRRYGPETFLEANAGRLVQLFVNLVVNAAQALEDGSPDEELIEVLTRVEEGRLVVTVRDTGSGIPEDVLPHVFDPFFTTKPEGQGTGLGLAIANEIAREHGGEILIETSAGVGTTMTVRLPITERAGRDVLKEPDADERHSIKGARILIIDDETQIVQTLALFLEPSCTVVKAGDIATAMTLIEDGTPVDVILCDVIMPGGGAPALRQWLSVRAPDLLGRMISMTGGHPGKETADTGAMLYKPFRLRDLQRAIARILQHSAYPNKIQH